MNRPMVDCSGFMKLPSETFYMQPNVYSNIMRAAFTIIFLILMTVSCSNKNNNDLDKYAKTKTEEQIDKKEIFPDFVTLSDSDIEKFRSEKNSKWFRNGVDRLYYVPYTDYSITTLILTNKKLDNPYYVELLSSEKINVFDEENSIKIAPIITDKNLKLGVSKEYVEKNYGKSDSVKVFHNTETHFWYFLMKADEKEDFGGNLTPFVHDGLDFSAEMTFENNKLTTLIYSYAVP